MTPLKKHTHKHPMPPSTPPMDRAESDAITMMKAIGIVLMVVGHATYGMPYIRPVIYMFHMPLFYLAAGYCFKLKYLDNGRTFLAKRVKGLYLPFVKWTLVFLLLHNWFFTLGFYDESVPFYGGFRILPMTLSEMGETALSIVFTMRGQTAIVSQYWFLNSLFWGSLFAWCLLRLTRNALWAAVAAMGLCVLFNVLHVYIPIWHITPQVWSVAFLFIVGHILRQRQTAPFSLTMAFACFALMVVGSFIWQMEMSSSFSSPARLVLYLTTAILAVWSLYSMLLRYAGNMPLAMRRLLLFTGRNTMPVLTFHFLVFKLVSLLIVWVHGLPSIRIADTPIMCDMAARGWWVAYSACGVLIPLGGAWLWQLATAKAREKHSKKSTL